MDSFLQNRTKIFSWNNDVYQCEQKSRFHMVLFDGDTFSKARRHTKLHQSHFIQKVSSELWLPYQNATIASFYLRNLYRSISTRVIKVKYEKTFFVEYLFSFIIHVAQYRLKSRKEHHCSMPTSLSKRQYK